MTQSTDDPTDDPGDASIDGEGEGWRDRALDRSLRSARAKAMSRSDRFIDTAMEILKEPGRNDFTVQELVDRSHTSLRSFYHYFSGKEELLLALLEESIKRQVAGWREDIEGLDTLEALRAVVLGIYGGPSLRPGASPNRGMARYHVGLAESHAEHYQRAIAPMARLFHELIDRGVAEGVVRPDVPADRLTRVFVQSVLGAALFTALGRTDVDRTAEAEAMWAFCRRGLVGSGPVASRA